jgi:hypothetical protein
VDVIGTDWRCVECIMDLMTASVCEFVCYITSWIWVVMYYLLSQYVGAFYLYERLCGLA